MQQVVRELVSPAELARTIETDGSLESAYLNLDLARLLEAQIVGDTHPERRRDLELVKNLVHSHTRKLARFRCENCGFKARQFHWRCPGCGGWETYPPRRTEERELA